MEMNLQQGFTDTGLVKVSGAMLTKLSSQLALTE